MKKKSIKSEPRYIVSKVTGEEILVSGDISTITGYVLYGFALMFLMLTFICIVIPFGKDCIYLTNNPIPHVSGTIREIHYSQREYRREKVVIETDDGKKMELSLEASKRYEGEYITVRYLPNLKKGEIID